MLKNPIPELVLFFDMEWVPDAAGAKRLFGLPDETTELDAMQAFWERASQYNAETQPRPFLKYLFSKVVSIAFLSRRPAFREGEAVVDFRLNSFPTLPLDGEPIAEDEIISKFLDSLGKHCPQLVGYNSAESDLQVLIQRGIVNEVSAAEFCRRPDKPWEGIDYFKRWDNEDHLDLIKLFSGRWDMVPRLDELAKLCGFPGKIGVSGEQVTDLWLAGDLQRIVEYNQIDVLNTYLVWLRIVHFTGQLTDEIYFDEQEQFRAFLESEAERPEKAFITQFLDQWPV